MTDQGSRAPENAPATAAGLTDGQSGSSPARASTDETRPSHQRGHEPGGAADTAPATASGADTSAAEQSRAAEMAQEDLLHRTRASVWYTGLIVAAILLILLMIFIAQNSQKVTIHFLGFSGEISVAIALVIATVVGVLLVAIPGGARMYQLRKRVKGLRKAVLED